MTRAARIEKYLPLLPAPLKVLYEAELAAGNELNDVEVGFDSDAGKIAVVVNYPFRAKVSPLPAGVMYREFKDRDPMLFEYYTADEKFMLLCGKFKPMKLEPLGPGPASPNEAHAAHMEKRAKELEIAAAERAARVPQFAPPPLPVSPPVMKPGTAGEKFIASMTMTFDMWHDGLGYDLAALDAATPAEKKENRGRSCFVASRVIGVRLRRWHGSIPPPPVQKWRRRSKAKTRTFAARRCGRSAMKRSTPPTARSCCWRGFKATMFTPA